MRSQSLEIYGWRLSRSARTGDRCRTDGIQSSEALRTTPNGGGVGIDRESREKAEDETSEKERAPEGEPGVGEAAALTRADKTKKR